jgi:hypothetical protein
MAYFPLDERGDTTEGMFDLFGPGHVDRTIRQAIQLCWMSLPKARRSATEVDAQFRRLGERALEDFREDSRVFGEGDEA